MATHATAAATPKATRSIPWSGTIGPECSSTLARPWAPPWGVAANTGAALAKTSVAETKAPQAAATTKRFHPRIH